MSQSLYELSAGFNNIFDMATDETMDLNELEGGLQAIEADVNTKVLNGIGLIQSLLHYSEAMKAEAKRLTDRQRVIDNRIKSIKSWYQQNLELMGKDKVTTERGVMAIQKNPPALKYDEVKIPEKYFDIVPQTFELNKDRLKADLKAGVNVPGAWFEQGRSLRIR
jgi:hypothetical protein